MKPRQPAAGARTPNVIVGFAGAEEAFNAFEREAFLLRDETPPADIERQRLVVAAKLKAYYIALDGELPDGVTDESIIAYVRDDLIPLMKTSEHWQRA